MKKILFIILSSLLILLSSCNCTKDNNKCIILTSNYAIYEWSKELTNNIDFFEIQMINESGIEYHSYTPSLDDLAKLNKANYFFCIGGESDDWVDNTIINSGNKNLNVLKLINYLGDKKIIQDGEIDEHLWLNPDTAIFCVNIIYDFILNSNQSYKDSVTDNYNNYLKQLNLIKNNYDEFFLNYDQILFFADRFPFIYLTKNYNLTYQAAYNGCHESNDLSFEKIAELINFVDKYQINTLFVNETSNDDLVNIIKTNSTVTDIRVYKLNSIQAISLNYSKSYLEIMNDNLDTFKKGYYHE